MKYPNDCQLSQYRFHNLKSDKHCVAHVQRTSNIRRWHWYHKRAASFVETWFEVPLRLPPKNAQIPCIMRKITN